MHHAVGADAAHAGIDQLVLVGELAKAAAAGALEAGMPAERVVHLASTADAVAAVPELLRSGDVVLIKGSRGMALERVVDAVRARRTGSEVR
jgi:UDP-N-acetylmuramoyl-tripeptide--D-alanyl-D-alanine ligase